MLRPWHSNHAVYVASMLYSAWALRIISTQISQSDCLSRRRNSVGALSGGKCLLN